METIKIYISLKEAEKLIFNKCFVIAKERLDIKRPEKLLAITISLKPENLQEFENSYLILFSAVTIFGIPKKEQNLFLNHYRVPLGLIELSSRNIRDAFVKKNLFDEIDSDFNAKKYLQLRNGLISISSLAYTRIENSEFKYSAEKVINEFTSLSDFRKKFLLELSNEIKFPLLTIKVENFVTDNYYRVIWWGKFIGDNYLNGIENITIDKKN
jgi:hypothetical protein